MSRYSSSGSKSSMWSRSSSQTVNDEFSGFSSALDEALGEIDRFLAPRTRSPPAPPPRTHFDDPFSPTFRERRLGPVSYDEFMRKTNSPNSTVDATSFKHVSSSEKRTAGTSRGPQSYYSRTRTEEFLGGSGREKDYYKMEEEVDADGPDTGRIRERQKEEYGSPGGSEMGSGRGSDWRERYFSPPASAGVVETPGTHEGGRYGDFGGKGARRWSESGHPDYYGTFLIIITILVRNIS